MEVHFEEVAFSGAEFLNDGTVVFFGDVDCDVFHRLAFDAVDGFEEDVGHGTGEFVAFAAHGFDEDREVHFTASRDLEAVGGLAVLDSEGDVAEEFLVEAFPELAGSDEFAFSSGERAVVDREGHLKCRLADLDEFERLDTVDGGYGVADRDVGGAGEADDVAHLR